MNPVERMNIHSDGFTKRECIVYDYILAHPTDFVHNSIYDTAKQSGVSRTAILRFAQKLGYAGFAEFKYDFSRYLHGGALHNLPENQSRMSEIIQVYQKTISLMQDTLCEADIQRLVEQLCKARRVKIFGVNRTGHSAQQLRQRFHKINFDGEAVTDYILIPEVARQGTCEDLHLYFSTQGETPVILDAISASKSHDVYTALVTMNDHSKMAKYADVVIRLPSTRAFVTDYFFDLQPVNMVFIEILVSYLSIELSRTGDKTAEEQAPHPKETKKKGSKDLSTAK